MTTPLTHPPSRVVAQMLWDSDYGTEPDKQKDWPIFIGNILDQPTNAGAVHDTAGVTDGRIRTGEIIEHFGIQIRFRGEAYPDVYAKTTEVTRFVDQEIANTFVQVEDRLYRVWAITRTGSNLFFRDEQERPSFTINGIMSAVEEEG